MRISSICPTTSGVAGGYFARNAARRAACASTAAGSGGGCGRNAATGPRPPWPGLRLRGLKADGPAVLALGRARDLGDDVAGARIVLAHRVLAEIDEAVAVDVHAVALRRVERADDAACAIEMDHRRRAHAAERERRVELGVQLDVREVVRAVVEPDVLVAVEREPRDAAELPVVRQVLRPRRIEDELGCLLCAGDRGSACRDEPCADEHSGPSRRGQRTTRTEPWAFGLRRAEDYRCHATLGQPRHDLRDGRLRSRAHR